jgi:hypothetical protein
MAEIADCVLLFVLLLMSAEAGRLAARSSPLLTNSEEILGAMRRALSLLVPMTGLVLGLLVSNGQASFDAQAESVSRIASSVSQLDELLRHYGEEATTAREQLRDETNSVLATLWDKTDSGPETIGSARAANEGFFDAIMSLEPKDDRQAVLKGWAVAIAISLVQERFYLATLEHSSFPMPVAAVIYLWLAMIFAVQGFDSTAHSAVRAVEAAVALSTSLALWLVFELDGPFDGLVQVSRQSMQVLSAASR